MKKLRLMTLLTSIALVIAILVLVIPNTGQILRAQGAAPTLAPAPTAGPPPPLPTAFWPVLDQPLTKEQAVVRALEIDEHFALWQDPWSQDTFSSQPDRITIEWHSNRDYDGDKYGPGAEMGPVWVITIKGPVKLRMAHPEEGQHDGLVYTIAQNSGSLLRWSAGPYVK